MAVNRDTFRRYSRPVLKTKRWQVLRHEVLERDNWQCTKCGTRRGRLEVDHVKSVRDRPDLAFEKRNLATLCSPCHTKKTRIECGHPEPSPERRAWASAVASMTAISTRQKENSNAG